MDLTPYLKPLIPIVIALVALKMLEALLSGLLDRLSSGKPLPYRLRDDFLSPAEHSFYLVLRQTVGGWAAICPKVSLGDLFYAKTGARRESLRARNRIDRKHVDFVLCHPETLRPMLGIELDDSSHQRSDRQERDRFVEGVFAAAGLPLARLPVHAAYATGELDRTLRGAILAQGARPKAAPAAPSSTVEGNPSEPPPCPKCGRPMVQRLARQGAQSGAPFWGCPDYPHCRGIRQIE